MAHENEDQHRPPLAPVLHTPRNEAVVDGRDVTFSWEPVEGATTYRLEVSPDTDFERIAYAAETTGETEIRTADEFPTDGQAFFWRVIALDGDIESSGDSIESFIAGTAEMAAQHLERPDENLGPIGALFTSAAHTAGREATGSDEYAEDEYEEGVEPESVASGQILGLALAIGVTIFTLAAILIFWTGSVYTETRDRAVAISGYPELRETRAGDEQALTQYRVIDDSAGVYGIPIDQAIDALVRDARGAAPRTYSRELPIYAGTANE